jgi:hypothetical protein
MRRGSSAAPRAELPDRAILAVLLGCGLRRGWIYETSRAAPFTVATSEGPSYRCVALPRMRAESLTGEQIKRSEQTA